MKKLGLTIAAFALAMLATLGAVAEAIAVNTPIFLRNTRVFALSCGFKLYQIVERFVPGMRLSYIVTRLSDIIDIPIYESYVAMNNPEKSRLVTSGVLVTSPSLNELATGAAKAMTIPYWNDLDPDAEPNYSNDDPEDIASADHINAGDMQVRKSFLNKIYGSMDLTRELSASDPMKQIRNRFGEYWTRQLQRRLIASALGVYADNVANDSGDMVKNAAIEDGNTAGATNLFSRSNFVDAAYTLGDNVGIVRAIAVHSVVEARMVKNDDIDFIPDSKGELTIPTYMGRLVIVDDSMPVVAGGTSGFKYTSMLFGANSFLFGAGSPLVESWIGRDEKAGNGGGMEEIGERREWIVHPNGMSWVEGSLVEFSPTLADLRLAAHWNRVAPRKNVGLAFLVTNG